MRGWETKRQAQKEVRTSAKKWFALAWERYLAQIGDVPALKWEMFMPTVIIKTADSSIPLYVVVPAMALVESLSGTCVYG
jgi:hypothetical protein